MTRGDSYLVAKSCLCPRGAQARGVRLVPQAPRGRGVALLQHQARGGHGQRGHTPARPGGRGRRRCSFIKGEGAHPALQARV
eukprot:scaffold105971_cov63-Phaeocystis_antarctica.AAC.4